MSSGSSPTSSSGSRLSAPGDNLQDGRTSLNDDLGAAIPRLSVDRFFDYVLPPLHPTLQNAVLPVYEHLTAPGVRAYSPGRKGWIAFLQAEGRGVGPKVAENQYFKALVVVATSIEAAVKAVVAKPPEQLLLFTNAPNTAPFSDWRKSSHRPDGYFLLHKRHKRKPASLVNPHWMDIGPTGEYKLRGSEEDARDNTRKVLWNMYHSLRDDPQRRFAFAFSIENKSVMRLWFTNRAEVLVSEKFDIMLYPKRLIRFFLTFFYSTRGAAGWDPTMEYIKGTMPLQYFITVNDDRGNRYRYKTLGLESSIGAEVLRGRGTRVWRAIRCDLQTPQEVGEQVALKDCWMDQSRVLEGEVIQQLNDLSDVRIARFKLCYEALQLVLRTSPNDQDLVQAITVVGELLKAAESLKASLLGTVIHGIVSSPDGRLDGTLDRDLILKDGQGNDVPWEYIFQEAKHGPAGDSQRLALQQQLKGEHRSVFEYLRVRREPILYDSKYHYRIVYAEVCRPLHQVKRLDHICAQLETVVSALEGLHASGWVHRDISAGNILITDSNVVKLSDWEYAKTINPDPQTVHDIRTGTVDFMAVEVNARDFRYLPSEDEDDAVAETRGVDPAGLIKGPPIPWRYNPLHDIESVLWLGKFFMENKDVVFIDKESAVELDQAALQQLKISIDETEKARCNRLTAQLDSVKELFHGTSNREAEITTARTLPHQWHFHPALQERSVWKDLEAMRRIIHQEYIAVERGLAGTPPGLFDIRPSIYTRLRTRLLTLKQTIGAIPAYVHVVPLADAALPVQDVHKPTHVTRPPRVGTVPTAGQIPAISIVIDTNDLPTEVTRTLRPRSQLASNAPSPANSRPPSRGPSPAVGKGMQRAPTPNKRADAPVGKGKQRAAAGATLSPASCDVQNPDIRPVQAIDGGGSGAAHTSKAGPSKASGKAKNKTKREMPAWKP